jgi:hypothetical protein
LSYWRPALTRQRILDQDQARAVVRDLVDGFNAMLASFATAHPKYVKYVDLRNVITRDDWENELLLTTKDTVR